MLKNSLRNFIIACTLSTLTSEAFANLLINPTRVQFNPSDRAADVTLINTSELTNTYRIEWAEKKSVNIKGYVNLTEAEAKAENFPIASSMIRFSPKQVVLKPGERQTIKLALRRPQDLADGEYRSHLTLKALPPIPPSKEEQLKNPTTSINILLTFAIPVVVQQGKLEHQITAETASINFNELKKTGSVSIDLIRSGQASVIGNLSAYWTPNGGAERLIAKIGDFNLWPETPKYSAELNWVGADFAATDGKLRITYEGSKDFRGQTFFEKSFTVKRSMIKPAN